MNDPEATVCVFCGKTAELRLGACWGCATTGEATAANRSVLEHLGRGIQNLAKGSPNARFDLVWAWERLTRTGDYSRGGYFDDFVPGWRKRP